MCVCDKPIHKQLIDKDGDGKLTIEELRERALHLPNLDPRNAEAVLKALDKDNKGYAFALPSHVLGLFTTSGCLELGERATGLMLWEHVS